MKATMKSSKANETQSQNDTLKVTGKTVRVDWDREKRIFIVTGRYGIPYWSERPEQDAGGKALED